MTHETMRGSTRGEFLRRSAGAAGLAVAGGLLAGEAAAAPQAEQATEAAAPTGYAAGSFALELGGDPVLMLRAAAGGATVAKVVSSALGESYPRKQLGGLVTEEIVVQTGISLGKDLAGWVTATVKGSSPKRGGALVVLDAERNVKRRRAFAGALISEIGLPALDAGSSEQLALTIGFVPESARTEKGSGPLGGSLGAKQKTALVSSFKLELDDLDTKLVTRIEPFAIRQGIVGNPVRAGKLEFPDLRVIVAEHGAQPWFDWFEDFVVKGRNAQSKERSGTIRLLAPNLKDELAQVKLFNVGIFRIDVLPVGTAAAPRIGADLYCERMELTFAE